MTANQSTDQNRVSNKVDDESFASGYKDGSSVKQLLVQAHSERAPAPSE